MDTCILDGGYGGWNEAWSYCYGKGGRLLQIPDSQYNDEFINVSITLNPQSSIWLGFVRNDSNEPPVRKWYYGQVVEDAWAPATIVNINKSGPYPFCGTVFHGKAGSNVQWSERSCANLKLPYHCQFPVFEGLYHKDSINNLSLNKPFFFQNVLAQHIPPLMLWPKQPLLS